MKLVFVGGPSRSGKSRISKDAANATGFDHVDLDKVESIRSLRSMTEGPKKNEAMKQAAADCVSGLTKNSIVEGSQLWPDDIQGYGLIEKLHACLFLGYADIKPEEKLKQLEERGLEDARHISEQSHNDQLQMLGRYIERSGKMRDIAAKHGIDYVDFSNWEHYEAKKDELISKILG